MSCDVSDDFVTAPDPNVQFQEDKEVIESFIQDRGLAIVDTTGSGVRYSIQESGEGQLVEVNDIVTMDYTAYTIGGIVFGTSVQAVADTAESITDPTEPIVFSHTSNGWGFNELFKLRSGAFTIDGFRDGVTIAFNEGHNGVAEFREGGKGVLAVPSKELTVTIDGNLGRPNGFPIAVIIYEFQVLKVRK